MQKYHPIRIQIDGMRNRDVQRPMHNNDGTRQGVAPAETFATSPTVYCILYTVYCILYTVYCIVYSVQCIVYSV